MTHTVTRAAQAVADMRAMLDPDMADVTQYTAAELAEIERQLARLQAQADDEHQQEDEDTAHES